MRPRSDMPRILPSVGVLFLLALALAPASGASAQGRTVGEYSFGGGALRVNTDGARVALYAEDRTGSQVLVYVDPSSIRQWLEEAGALVRRREEREERETSPLTHHDASMGGSVVLTRQPVARGTRPRLFLTVTGDPDHIALIPLTPMDARIVIAALNRASEETRQGP